MTTLAAYPTLLANESSDTSPHEDWHPPVVLDRSCLILSEDPALIATVDAAASRRCFRVDDYANVHEAAIAALFSPPVLAVIDLRLVQVDLDYRKFAALCRQLAADSRTQVALIGNADDEREEKLFRQVGATYYFPSVPTYEEMEQLAIGAAARVRVQQRRPTVELLRRASDNVRGLRPDARYRPAA